jgi:nucleoside-triphosphatase THEP1
MGKNILEDPLIINNDLIIVDEIGPYELDGKIWAESLTRLLTGQSCSILLVVREQLVNQVLQQWSLKDAMIIEFGQIKPDQAAAMILSQTRGI